LQLAAGQEVRTAGRKSLAVIRYRDGTRIELGPGTTAVLMNPAGPRLLRGKPFGKGVFLSEGKLTADVRKQPVGKPMVLATDRAAVEVLGTRLVLSASPVSTRVAVSEGRVRVVRRSDGETALVGAGHSAVVSPGKPLKAKALILDGLVLWLRLDEISGTATTDTSGVCRDVRLRGGEWNPRGGRIGGAIELNGRSDYVEIRDFPAASGPVTCTAWVYARSRPKSAHIVRSWDGRKVGLFRLGLQNGLLTASFRRAGGQVVNLSEPKGRTFPLGSWQHVAVVADDGVIRLYRNGRVVARKEYDGGLAAAPPVLNVGGGPVPAKSPATMRDPQRYWRGMIDEVRLYRRGLGGGEIRAIAGGAW
jgi:hypothetical protein